jgi:hydroxymethylglutaryl-CoA reductase (NADPH)
MQRAPVFIFGDAREAREFRGWVEAHLEEIRRAAEATTSVGKLSHVETHLVGKFAFLRFNFTTGDAAGQNMVSRATSMACMWILQQKPAGVCRFFLEGNLATDKKPSMINLLAGANNNGLHSSNGIAALFLATGQDVANVAEGCAGILYAELTPGQDLYLSITIPSLIVATHGGGTALPTQRECLQVLGCAGKGKVRKLAEIIAGVVLAGEISLGAAISSQEWVSAHERHGRNR